MGQISDHIMMVSRNGAKKAVPIWQIKQWIEARRFNPIAGKANFETIGYDFADQESALKDLAVWQESEARKLAAAKIGVGTPERVDGGIAEAHLKPPIDSSVFGRPPIPAPGEETISKSAIPARGKPEDVI
jgi:hypothetical protein